MLSKATPEKLFMVFHNRCKAIREVIFSDLFELFGECINGNQQLNSMNKDQK